MIAYGVLNLKPDDFWDLTQREIMELHEGYLYRRKEEEDLVGLQICWIARPHYKEKLTIDKVMGRKTKVERMFFATKEEKDAYLKQILRKEGPAGGS